MVTAHADFVILFINVYCVLVGYYQYFLYIDVFCSEPSMMS